MEAQQYMLRCKDFYERIGASIQRLYGDDEFIDVTIACDGTLFKAHKMILSACSPYFRKILQENPCQHPVILLQNVQEKNMKDLLSFIYYGEVNIELDSLETFLKTAKFLQVEGLVDINDVPSQNNNFGINTPERYSTRMNMDTSEERIIDPINETTSSQYLNEIRNEQTQKEPQYITMKKEPYYSDFDEDSSNSSSIIQQELVQPQSNSKTSQETVTQPQKSPSPQTSSPSQKTNTESKVDRAGLSPVQCNICGRVQKNEYYLKFHLAKAHQLKSYFRFMPTDVSGGEFKCPFCVEKYHTKRDMNAHILTVHQKENYSDMKCSLCAKQFSSVSNRNQHVLRYHAKVLD